MVMTLSQTNALTPMVLVALVKAFNASVCVNRRVTRGGPPVCFFCRFSKLESDHFPHTSLRVNTSSKVSLTLGYEGCLRSRFLDVFKSTG